MNIQEVGKSFQRTMLDMTCQCCFDVGKSNQMDIPTSTDHVLDSIGRQHNIHSIEYRKYGPMSRNTDHWEVFNCT